MWSGSCRVSSGAALVSDQQHPRPFRPACLWCSARRLVAMTPEDEEFLTELYRNLTKQAVPPTSPLYVPLEELPGQVMGTDAVKLLCRTITMTTPGEAFFLTGLRGSGKTVQLLRLKQDLQRRGFAVVMFSAEDYLNMHEPLNVVDEIGRAHVLTSVTPISRMPSSA